MRISDWSSDVCSSDLDAARDRRGQGRLSDRARCRFARLLRRRSEGDRAPPALEPAQRRPSRTAPRPYGAIAERGADAAAPGARPLRSEGHTSEIPSLNRNPYSGFFLEKKKITTTNT